MTNDQFEEPRYAGKVLCVECGEYYHPDKYKMCWDCWSKKLPNTTTGYASVKDATESEDINF